MCFMSFQTLISENFLSNVLFHPNFSPTALTFPLVLRGEVISFPTVTALRETEQERCPSRLLPVNLLL